MEWDNNKNRVTITDIVKYEEFISKLYGKGKISVNNEFFKSCLLKSTEEDIHTFVFSTTNSKGGVFPVLISTYKEYNGNKDEITGEKLYINYFFDIEQSIADIYSAYICFIRYAYYK